MKAKPYDWPHDGDPTPRETALLVIDMQRDFCDPQGYVAAMGYDIEPARRIIPNIATVKDAVSKWGGLVVQTREGHRPDLSDLFPFKAWRSRNAGVEIGMTGPLGRVLVRGEEGWRIIPELAPAPSEILIDKPGYSAFQATDLHQILVARGVGKLILTGVTTDVCVHSTLRHATDLGYECLVLEDACAATVPAHHDAAIGTIATEGGIFGAVTQSNVLCAFLSGREKI
ncbi:cysteine hydrolase family protein [Acidocella sp.]|uniref:cysteine hydrolase family protein n=1 Tax=Acidocella sp. TaxID=50710 RepID=UPI003D01A27B